MKLARIIPVLLLAALVSLAGCKKKPKTMPPPQAQPPVVTEPEKPPTQPTQPQPQPQPTQPQPTTTETAKPPVTAKPKPKKPVAKKTTPPAPPATTPKNNKTVVQEGGANETGQLSAAIPDTQANHQRMNTAQLLDATEANLKRITRPLSTDEQAMVQQIRSYMQQSRAATTEGDTERAYNLAYKAHLLSDELVKTP